MSDLCGVHPPADGLLGVDQGLQPARCPVHLAEQQVQTLGALGGPLHATRRRALAPGGPDRGKGLDVKGSVSDQFSLTFKLCLYADYLGAKFQSERGSH